MEQTTDEAEDATGLPPVTCDDRNGRNLAKRKERCVVAEAGQKDSDNGEDILDFPPRLPTTRAASRNGTTGAVWRSVWWR